jgi:hypothetical protein
LRGPVEEIRYDSGPCAIAKLAIANPSRQRWDAIGPREVYGIILLRVLLS